ncbi:MAG: nicotinate (nicotinamide) nucleotide adenylyltransferase [Planctomycetota bacterium]|nr:nicotinate (nicotinamide) nucleotide adenylyltransferase [Planctomycetota bacterium]
MNTPERRILIFGGTFDPPHLAHTTLPPIVAKMLGCELILYIPASINPLKTQTPPTPSVHRLSMLRLAIASIPNALIDELELHREGPSFTIDTLEALQNKYGPETKLHLLIGADAALSFEKWKDWQRILEMVEPIVMPRPPYDHATLIREFNSLFKPEQAAYWIAHIAEVPYLDVSASDIRQMLINGQDLSQFLLPEVAHYLKANELYQMTH